MVNATVVANQPAIDNTSIVGLWLPVLIFAHLFAGAWLVRTYVLQRRAGAKRGGSKRAGDGEEGKQAEKSGSVEDSLDLTCNNDQGEHPKQLNREVGGPLAATVPGVCLECNVAPTGHMTAFGGAVRACFREPRAAMCHAAQCQRNKVKRRRSSILHQL